MAFFNEISRFCNYNMYFIFKIYIGTFECRLCLTLHNNEGSYLVHTQGKKHQSNLGKRAAKDAEILQRDKNAVGLILLYSSSIFILRQ